MAATLSQATTHELRLETKAGSSYTGRITATRIAEDRDVEVYLTEGEDVLVYLVDRMTYVSMEDPEADLGDWARTTPTSTPWWRWGSPR